MYSAILYFRFSFLVTENTRWISRASYFSVVISTAFYVALIPKFGFTGAAIGLFLATTLQFMLEYFLGRRCYDMNVRPAAFMGIVAVCYALLFLSEAINPTEGFWTDTAWRGFVWLLLSSIPLAFMLRKPETREMIGEAAKTIRKRVINGAN